MSVYIASRVKETALWLSPMEFFLRNSSNVTDEYYMWKSEWKSALYKL